jgi:hypothetical protein
MRAAIMSDSSAIGGTVAVTMVKFSFACEGATRAYAHRLV